MPSVKAIKGGKTEKIPGIETITLRGVEYTVRELDVVEYKECLKAATNEAGLTPFQDLLDAMVLRAVKPSPATMSKPLPYPVYRTLEDLVNVLHFTILPDEAEAPEKDADADTDETPEEPAPNS